MKYSKGEIYAMCNIEKQVLELRIKVSEGIRYRREAKQICKKEYGGGK